MKEVSRHALAWTVSVCLTLLLCEATGAVLFLRSHGALVYRNRPEIKPQQAVPGDTRKRLHPYLGYSLQYTDAWPNSLGLSSRQFYQKPYEAGPNDLIVAVFGGSLAVNLVIPSQDGLSLAAALKEHPEFSGKNIVVYALGQAAAKQPQAVMALAMFQTLGWHADVVLSLDGANEFSVGYENIWYHTHPIFPSLAMLWAIGGGLAPLGQNSAEFYRVAYQLAHAKAGAAARSDLANRANTGLSFLINTVLAKYHERQEARAQAEYAKALDQGDKGDNIKKMLSLDIERERKLTDPWEDLFQIWLRSSDEMAALAKAGGSRYLHIVHPNQYFSKKVFSPMEAEVALTLPANMPTRIGLERGYALLDQRSELLASRGIVSAIHLFDAETRPTYIDNCCHYTREGETILARFVARQLAAIQPHTQ
jgi:hypothetical protein